MLLDSNDGSPKKEVKNEVKKLKDSKEEDPHDFNNKSSEDSKDKPEQ